MWNKYTCTCMWYPTIRRHDTVGPAQLVYVCHMFLLFFHSLLTDHVFGLGKETKELFDVLGKPILDGVINRVNGEGVCVCVCVCVCARNYVNVLYVCMYV